MIRTLVAGVAITGSLVFGAAGMAGAASSTTSPTTPAVGTATSHAAVCGKAEARATKLTARESKAAAWVTKAQAREAKAISGNHPKAAKRMARRIARVQKVEARGEKLLAKISARCGTGSPT